MDESLDIDREGMLDHTPLKFGKYKGHTPEGISDLGKTGCQYLIWAYENVGNFDVCSAALYKDIGGKGKRAERKTEGRFFGNRTSGKDAAGNQSADPFADISESRSASSQPKQKSNLHLKNHFDDMDDDIPF